MGFSIRTLDLAHLAAVANELGAPRRVNVVAGTVEKTPTTLIKPEGMALEPERVCTLVRHTAASGRRTPVDEGPDNWTSPRRRPRHAQWDTGSRRVWPWR